MVGDRQKLLGIGFAAVSGACVVFAIFRLASELATGRATPWWGNAAASVALGILYLWYRGDRSGRSSAAVHGVAAIATIVVLIPVAYGMTSSKWWLSLVGFAVLLMGRRSEAVVWTILTAVLMSVTAVVEPLIALPGTSAEPAAERALAGFFFVSLLLAITWAFRREAQRRARDLAMTAASLERANAVKSRFLAHVSHEVRTPLHAIIAMTDMALGRELPRSAADEIATARESARLLLSLLNNVLDVTRAESDAMQLDLRPFRLHATLDDAIRPLAAQARAKGLAFEATSDPGVVESRVGDRMRLSQIALNLVGNAVKFTREGRIGVHLRTKDDDPDRVVLEVRDTGAGIPKERLAAIFEPFTQGKAADAAVQGGAGLGLAIVRELATLMDGAVSVTSEGTTGSTFTVELRLPRQEGATDGGPIELARPHGDSAPPARVPRGGGLHVLVCEDDPVNQRVVLAMLDRLGERVTVARDGIAAWNILQRGEVDVVLTDVEMPGLSGLELARRVRARERERGWARMPMVAATAHVAQEAEILAAGMDAYLGKPFTLRELADVLDDVRRPSTREKASVPPRRRSSTPPESVEVLDGQVVEELRRLEVASGTPLLSELLASFRGDVPARVEELRLAATQGDTARVGSLAHRLRGSASVIGASRVVARAIEIEAHAGSTPAEATLAKVDELAREVGRAMDAFSSAVAVGPRLDGDAAPRN